jgi:O-antigen ligase
MLAFVLLIGLTLNWFIAAGGVALFLIHRVRPFDFVASFLLVTCGSTFVYHAGGHLTKEIALLSAAILLMLFCYWLAKRDDALQIPRSTLTTPLVAYVVLSLLNYARGVVFGHSIKDASLEILPVLALATTPLVANGFAPARDMRFTVGTLVTLAYASASLGYYMFGVVHRRVSGIFFHPIPGLVAVILVNLALRARKPTTALLWIGLALPLYLHQFLSFRRGLWTGGMVAMFVTVLVFAFRSRTSGRWKRVGLIFATLVVVGVVGTVAMATLYGTKDILEEAGSRFVSIGSTQMQKRDVPTDQGTMANVERILEYTTVIRHIRESPWVGHGIGYSFTVRSFLHSRVEPQWWVHENYLLVWLKQGIVGLALFVWMLGSAIWLGARNARRSDDEWTGSWFAATAACTAFMAVLAISDFPFDLLGEGMFFLALLWGGSMAMANRGAVKFRWSPPHETSPR